MAKIDPIDWKTKVNERQIPEGASASNYVQDEDLNVLANKTNEVIGVLNETQAGGNVEWEETTGTLTPLDTGFFSRNARTNKIFGSDTWLNKLPEGDANTLSYYLENRVGNTNDLTTSNKQIIGSINEVRHTCLVTKTTSKNTIGIGAAATYILDSRLWEDEGALVIQVEWNDRIDSKTINVDDVFMQTIKYIEFGIGILLLSAGDKGSIYIRNDTNIQIDVRLIALIPE